MTGDDKAQTESAVKAAKAILTNKAMLLRLALSAYFDDIRLFIDRL